MLLISNVIADGSEPVAKAYRRACDGLDEMEARLNRALPRNGNGKRSGT